MTHRVGYIAANTFREAVRDRVLYNLVFFALLLVGSAPLFSQISIGMEKIILVNLGLTAISVFGVVIAIFIGIGLVSKEIDKRTLYTVLAHPVRRWEFILGKYFGLAATLLVNTAFMVAGFFLLLVVLSHGRPGGEGSLLAAIYLIILQFFVITAIALFFSSFSTPLLSALFSFGMFVIGSFSEDLRGFASIAHGPQGWLANAVSYLVPNFSAMNVITQAAHQQPISGLLIVHDTFYAFLYSVVALSAAMLIFERRDLN